MRRAASIPTSTVARRPTNNIGDATAGGPNPNLGALSEAPFYAVRLYPGDIGASTGLVTDAQARLLDAQQQVLPGLYAVGNDMNSIMGGVYTGPASPSAPAWCLPTWPQATRAGLAAAR
jgi:hypothetical protein